MALIEHLCPVCGVTFYRTSKHANQKHCSRECSSKGRKCISYTKRVCLTCVKEFKVRTTMLKHRACNYCSKKCAGMSKTGWVKKRYKHLKWAKAVVSRDKVCQECKSKTDLQAHHIMLRSEYPELQYDVDNGLTLCIYCHADKHPVQRNLILSRLQKKV